MTDFRLFTRFSSLLLACVAVCIVWQPAFACLWFYGTSVNGEAIRIGARGLTVYIDHLTHHSDETDWHAKRLEVEKTLQPDSDYKVRSDYAAILAHDGEYKKAIQILEEIEHAHPGEYVIAANLGTAYELDGNDVKGLEWIRECLKRNPESHFGTEWLHEKILEAKLEIAKDPNWLKTHSILGMDFGGEPKPQMPLKWIEGRQAGAEPVIEALEYQLHERLAFVKPPNPVVADLIFDLANLLALTKSVEHSIAVYDLALKYQPLNADIVSQRREYLNSIAIAAHAHDTLYSAVFYAIVGILIFCLLSIWYQIRKKRAAIKWSTI